MFKTYTYIESPIQDIQKYIEEIVMLWIEADAPFDESMITNSLLLALLKEIKINGRFWIDEIIEIYEAFRVENLTDEKKEALTLAFYGNNEIELLCKNEWTVCSVYHYTDLPISDALKRAGRPQGLLVKFFKDCYDEILKRKPFEESYETTKVYFDKLIEASNIKICPFCALNDLKSQFDDGRDAFDHYLAKATYPFSSVNFRNLVPMCHPCNSGHKLEKDPLHSDKNDKSTRRKAFNPFGENDYDIKVDLDFTRQGLRFDKLQNEDLNITLTCPTHPEEVITWNDVFDIEERYKAKVCQKFTDWIGSLRKEYRKKLSNRSVTNFRDFLEDKIDYFEYDWFEEKNFLKYAVFSKMQEMGTLTAAFGEV